MSDKISIGRPPPPKKKNEDLTQIKTENRESDTFKETILNETYLVGISSLHF